MVKLIAIFVAASYVFLIIAYACVWCRPPSDYLAVEPSYGKVSIYIFHNYCSVLFDAQLTLNADECQNPEGHLISVATLDISTNFLLLALAIPLLFQAGFTSLRKFTVAILAIFVLATVSLRVCGI